MGGAALRACLPHCRLANLTLLFGGGLRPGASRGGVGTGNGSPSLLTIRAWSGAYRLRLIGR